MKKILAILIVFIAVILILPFGMGFLVKDKFEQVINNIPTNGNVKTTLVNYKRGWFSSTAEIRVDMIAPLQNMKAVPSKPIIILVFQHITHGPFLFDKNAQGRTSFHFGQAYILSIVNQAGASVDLSSLIKINGAISNTLHDGKILLDSKSLKIVADGINANADVSPAIDHVQGDLSVANFTVITPLFTQHMKNLNVTYNLKKTPQDLWVGKKDSTVAKLSYSWANVPLFTGDDLVMNVNTNESQGKLNADVNVTLQDLKANGKTYGPHKLSLTIHSVNADLLHQLSEQLNVFRSTAKPTPEQFRAFSQTFMKLLGKGLDITIHQLQISTPQGNVDFEAKVDLPAQASDTPNVFALLRDLNVKVDLQAPVALTQKLLKVAYQAELKKAKQQPTQKSAADVVNEQLNDLISNGQIIHDGDFYKTQISYNNMQLLINGKPMTPTARKALSVTPSKKVEKLPTP